MYQVTDANTLSVMALLTAMMLTPLYIFVIYVFSGASPARGLKIAAAFVVLGGFTSWVVLADATRALGPFAALSVPLAWFIPSLILWWKSDWFLAEELSQKWLIGFQVFRIVGGVFLIEMLVGNVPGIFAYPAGIGDVSIGILAATVLLVHRNSAHISAFAIGLVIILGLVDLSSAFFFAFTTTAGPGQIFFPEIANNISLFPVGVVPMFLVPAAIFLHILSLLNYRKYQRPGATSAATSPAISAA